MAQPEYVPTPPARGPGYYQSPPRRPDSWRAERPGEVVESGQPVGDRLGRQGPDQGYVFRLVRHLEPQLRLLPGEALDDVVAACAMVATKRASIFGRAPVVHDLTVAFTVWGFLDDSPPAELAALRRAMFAEVASSHHYGERRAVVDAVPEETLRLPHQQVAQAYRQDWRSLLALAESSNAH
ncbi:MAG: hypothetical protein ACKVWR_19710 [Acidimicrobiales bacterium]